MSRLTLSGSDNEFDQLARSINQMLDRIDLLMGSVKRVSSNIAHDLRTPHCHLRFKAEERVNLQERDTQEVEVITELITEIDNLQTTSSAILRIAEIESCSQSNQFFKNKS